MILFSILWSHLIVHYGSYISAVSFPKFFPTEAMCVRWLRTCCHLRLQSGISCVEVNQDGIYVRLHHIIVEQVNATTLQPLQFNTGEQPRKYGMTISPCTISNPNRIYRSSALWRANSLQSMLLSSSKNVRHKQRILDLHSVLAIDFCSRDPMLWRICSIKSSNLICTNNSNHSNLLYSTT